MSQRSPGESAVRSNIVWMRGFFYEIRGYIPKLFTHLERAWKRPLLVSVQHDQSFCAHKFTQHEGAAQVALAIAGSDFQLESVKPFLHCLPGQRFHLIIFILEPTDGCVVSGLATA